MKNILTFDIEDWHHANYPDMKIPEFTKEHSLEDNVLTILDLCKKNNAKGTFFILSSEAEKNPKIVERILKDGHEIGSHGYSHKLIYKMDKDSFREDLRKSIEILKNLTGLKPISYRAPSWSVRTDMLWFFKCLKEEGIRFDSSIFPLKTFLFGDPSSPIKPYEIEGIVEIPASAINFIKIRIPFGGGFSFRLFPLFLTEYFIKNLNRKGIPAVAYLHPREIDPEHPKLSLPLKERFIHYYNIKNTLKKLEKLLKKFDFVSIGEFFDN